MIAAVKRRRRPCAACGKRPRAFGLNWCSECYAQFPVVDVARSAWLHQRETESLASLLQENRTLRAQLDQPAAPTHRRPTPPSRRTVGHRLGRACLQKLATIVTPDRGRAGQDTP